MDVATSVTPRSNKPRNKFAEQHRIGDVCDEQFIETQHSSLAGDLFGDELERIGAILVLLQLVMDELHEAMKVTALLVLERQAVEEQIHEPGLAATDAAPDIQALLEIALLAATQQPFQQALRSRGAIRRARSSSSAATTLFLCGIRGIAQAFAFALDTAAASVEYLTSACVVRRAQRPVAHQELSSGRVLEIFE